VKQGKTTQKLLTLCEVLGLLLLVVAGVVAVSKFGAAQQVAAPAPAGGAAPFSLAAVGMAMVFVLLTYGGWNEAAYLSAEVKSGPKGMLWALLGGIGLITVIYLLANSALLLGLGLPGMAGSQAVAADLMQRAGGETWAKVLSVLVVIAALSTVNATIFTGARTNYAFGRDFGLFAPLGRWRAGAETPANALLAQGVIALVLVFIGGIWKDGVRSMVDYTTPVFWLFFLLTGLSLIVLRSRDPGAPRPFRVPLYPVTPILFCLACLYMLYSSLAYVRLYALGGVAVLAAGVPLLFFARSNARHQPHPSQISAFPVIIGAKEGR
jgi:amino acid transporter